MTTPPLLDTERLRLRIPSLEDADDIGAYASDPEVSRYVSWRRHRSPEEAREFLRRALTAIEHSQELHWVITARDSERVLGTIGLLLQGHRVELGCVLARPHWGRGFATEAARAIVDWALARPEIHRVWAVCNVDNLASATVLEKVGMYREGRLRRWAIFPNLSDEPRDCWCYARVR
jgi:ribosomal-protein-alanine N-acetyltransferase